MASAAFDEPAFQSPAEAARALQQQFEHYAAKSRSGSPEQSDLQQLLRLWQEEQAAEVSLRQRMAEGGDRWAPFGNGQLHVNEDGHYVWAGGDPSDLDAPLGAPPRPCSDWHNDKSACGRVPACQWTPNPSWWEGWVSPGTCGLEPTLLAAELDRLASWLSNQENALLTDEGSWRALTAAPIPAMLVGLADAWGLGEEALDIVRSSSVGEYIFRRSSAPGDPDDALPVTDVLAAFHLLGSLTHAAASFSSDGRPWAREARMALLAVRAIKAPLAWRMRTNTALVNHLWQAGGRACASSGPAVGPSIAQWLPRAGQAAAMLLITLLLMNACPAAAADTSTALAPAAAANWGPGFGNMLQAGGPGVAALIGAGLQLPSPGALLVHANGGVQPAGPSTLFYPVLELPGNQRMGMVTDAAWPPNALPNATYSGPSTISLASDSLAWLRWLDAGGPLFNSDHDHPAQADASAQALRRAHEAMADRARRSAAPLQDAEALEQAADDLLQADMTKLLRPLVLELQDVSRDPDLRLVMARSVFMAMARRDAVLHTQVRMLRQRDWVASKIHSAWLTGIEAAATKMNALYFDTDDAPAVGQGPLGAALANGVENLPMPSEVPRFDFRGLQDTIEERAARHVLWIDEFVRDAGLDMDESFGMPFASAVALFQNVETYRHPLYEASTSFSDRLKDAFQIKLAGTGQSGTEDLVHIHFKVAAFLALNELNALDLGSLAARSWEADPLKRAFNEAATFLLPEGDPPGALGQFDYERLKRVMRDLMTDSNTRARINMFLAVHEYLNSMSLLTKIALGASVAATAGTVATEAGPAILVVALALVVGILRKLPGVTVTVATGLPKAVLRILRAMATCATAGADALYSVVQGTAAHGLPGITLPQLTIKVQRPQRPQRPSGARRRRAEAGCFDQGQPPNDALVMLAQPPLDRQRTCNAVVDGAHRRQCSTQAVERRVHDGQCVYLCAHHAHRYDAGQGCVRV